MKEGRLEVRLNSEETWFVEEHLIRWIQTRSIAEDSDRIFDELRKAGYNLPSGLCNKLVQQAQGRIRG